MDLWRKKIPQEKGKSNKHLVWKVGIFRSKLHWNDVYNMAFKVGIVPNHFMEDWIISISGIEKNSVKLPQNSRKVLCFSWKKGWRFDFRGPKYFWTMEVKPPPLFSRKTQILSWIMWQFNGIFFNSRNGNYVSFMIFQITSENDCNPVQLKKLLLINDTYK